MKLLIKAAHTSILIIYPYSNSSVVSKTVSGSTGVDPIQWHSRGSQQMQSIITTADIDTLRIAGVKVNHCPRGVKPVAVPITGLISPADEPSIHVTAQLADCQITISGHVCATKAEIHSWGGNDTMPFSVNVAKIQPLITFV